MMKKSFFGMILIGAAVWVHAATLPESGTSLPASSEQRDPAALVKLLSGATNDARIVIPPGIYRFCDTAIPGVTLKGLQRATIIADGVTVVFKVRQSFNLDDCEEVTLTCLTVDYDP